MDLSIVLPGHTRHDALMNSIEVAQYIERLGFFRIWVAEHHGAGFIAGRAPEVLIFPGPCLFSWQEAITRHGIH